MSGAARVLVVEDNATQAELARALIGGLGHEVRVAGTAALALATAQDWQPDAILLDVELPDYNGFELMVRLKSAGIDAAVLVVTANGSVNSAVEAMRAGAVDFLVKPYAKARLSVTLGNVLESRALRAELGRVRARLERDSFFGFIGASAPMQAAYRTIESVAASRASVFITGESGTGKELAAEAIHKASPRAGRGFVALNCGAIPRELLESEVFGHVRGAFTGAAADRVGAARLADGGTLFLDEIGEMPLEMQVKLLRFVQTGSFAPVGASRVERVDVRFVCATNRDPMIEVQEGRFREDLFYRLHVVPLELPPLRAREGDVLLIARHFLTSFAREEGRRFERFSPEAEARLAAYAWPGNVRQLQNVVRNVVVLHDGAVVEAAMLPPPLGAAGEGGG
ncbi:MAG: sigma-54 dependent transcriptional regulator, partial [Rhodospirillales bacterium]|nr:sigma-54 dependent transcriptional regulator [Rhodospirillales bacterium]